MKLPAVRWLQAAAILLPLALLAAAWKWTDLRDWAHPDRLAETFAPFRSSWFGAPLMVVIFVVAELFMFPVLVLILVSGIVFGPWIGTLVALAGSLASAIVPFLAGRKLGHRRLERIGGAALRALDKVLAKRGVLAVFLVRKIPAPFTLVNLACGASRVSMSDFVYGTLLGMGTGIVLITVLGDRLIEIVHDPTPRHIALSILFLLVPVIPALLIQRAVNRRMEARR
jgi:phospholipase D1/2